MKKIAAMAFFFFTLAAVPATTPPDRSGAFADWPLDSKLETALVRLQAASGAAKSDREQQGYAEALDLVRRAKGEYLAFRGAEAPIHSGSTDPADCPFGLMKVMRICAEGLIQSNAEWQRSPRSPQLSAAAAQQATNAILAAEQAFQQATGIVDGLQGWTTHTGHNGMIVRCPPEFKVRPNKNFPLALHVQDALEKDERVVLITWKYMPSDLTEWQFQEKAIHAHKNNFADFQLLESWQQWPGVPGHWFWYRYRWEGQDITALIYQNAFGPLPWELRYLAVADRFNGEECEEIVRSLRRDG
ncbi:MAG: hypothetical protein MUC72_01810 [Acidobacteria bacterium]|jgi:hypothetical protein|nr:hypothetical protein [Acidobacteriota bacterium]